MALLGRLQKHPVHGINWAPAQVIAIGQVIDGVFASELCLVAGKTKALIKAHADETKLGFKCVKQLAELLDPTKVVSSPTESGEDAEKFSQVRSEAEKLVFADRPSYEWSTILPDRR